MMMPIPAELKAFVLLSLALALWLTFLIRADYAEVPGAARIWRLTEDFVSQFLLLLMLAASTVQVLARYLLPDDVSLPWTEEAGRLFMVWGTLWGAAALQRTDEHINMSAVFSLLPPAGQRLVLMLCDLITIALLTPIAWWGWNNARALDIMMSISLGVPLSIFAYSIPVTAGLMIIYSIALLFKRLTGRPVRLKAQTLEAQ
jgi:C4-dicarboxylate transporter, DctQ subunit